MLRFLKKERKTAVPCSRLSFLCARIRLWLDQIGAVTSSSDGMMLGKLILVVALL